MLTKHMKKISLNTISLLLFFVYLFYSQLYPFVHIHTHEKDIQKPVIELCFHPVDDCRLGHNCNDDVHHKKHKHVTGAQDHTHIKVQNIIPDLLFGNTLAALLLSFTPSRQLYHQTNAILVPQNVINRSISRAPPRIS